MNVSLIVAIVSACAAVVSAVVQVRDRRERLRVGAAGNSLQPRSSRRGGNPALTAIAGVASALAIAFFVLWATEHSSGKGPGPPQGTTATTGTSQAPSSPTPRPAPEHRVPELTAEQLQPVLVSLSEFESIAPQEYDSSSFSADTNRVALMGGLSALKLCSSPLPAQGMGAEASASYSSNGGPVSAPEVNYGTAAASFATVEHARQLLAGASANAPTCGWRLLPGSRLDDEAVRLTKRQAGSPAGEVSVDVVLARASGSVVEVAGISPSGSSSADIDRVAGGAAARLKQVVSAG